MTAAEGYGDYGTAQEFIDAHEQSVFELAHNREEREVAGAALVARASVDRVRRAMEKPGGITGAPTGLRGVDERTGGYHGGQLIIIAARPGMGKALGVDEPVLTPTGWRRMGDLRVGDRVIGADGRPTTVLGVYDQGIRPAFRLTMDDGASVVCDDEHLWFTRNRGERRTGASGSVRTTREVRATLSRAESGGLNHSISYVAPVHFESESERPLDAWLLGVLLGDGGCTGSTPRLHNPEADIRERAERSLPPGDRYGATTRLTVSIVGGATARALAALELDGCRSWEKFIPRAYLLAPIEERVALLQGLCDTDGYVTTPGRRSVELCTASERLADDVEFLVRSLGGAVSKRVRPTHYIVGDARHEARPSCRMVISFPSGTIVPVSSRKHLAKWTHGQHRVRERFIASIVPEGQREMRCIRVDAADALYVTSGFIVTHNTAYILGIALHAAAIAVTKEIPIDDPQHEAGFVVVIFSLEMPLEELGVRAACHAARLDVSAAFKGQLGSDGYGRFLRAAEWFARLPIEIDDTPALGLLELRAKLRRIQRKHPKRKLVVILDYLQLMGAPAGVDNREQEISTNSRGLKAIAKEFGAPMIALSQLNRGPENRPDKRPQLSDLRESGAIEQDADVVQFLFRPEYYAGDPSKVKPEEIDYAEVITAKQRNGPLGRDVVAYRARSTRFDNPNEKDLERWNLDAERDEAPPKAYAPNSKQRRAS